MKPFIHLFNTPKNYYFFDVNKNENVRIEKETYGYLKMILENKINDTNRDIKLEKKLKALKDDGYLSENRIKEIKHPATYLLDTYLSRKLGLLTIQLTHQCNLRCDYCAYTSNDGTYRLHENNKISFDTIKKSLHFLKKNSIDRNEVTIGFYGGEPLIEFHLIKETVDYCKEIFEGKKVDYTITTNGTLLSDEVLDLFIKENFNIVISLDGPKEINDKNRKFLNSDISVFEKVIENINYINEHYEPLIKNMSISMVIDPTQDFKKYKLLFDEYPIFKNINMNISLVEDDYKLEKFRATEEFINDFNYVKFLSYLHYFGEIDLSDNKFYMSIFYQSIVEMFMDLAPQGTLGEINCPSGPCIPGGGRLMVDVEGRLFPCEKVSENIHFNCIGCIDKGLDIAKSSNVLNIARLTIESCKDCFALKHCTLCVKAHGCSVNGQDKIAEKCNEVRNNFHQDLIGMEIINEIILE